MNIKNIIPEKIMGKIRKDKRILAVAIYGSYTRGESFRDIDIAIILDKKIPNIGMSHIKLEYSSIFSDKFDIKVY